MSVVETVLMLCYLGNKDKKKKSLHMFGTEAFLFSIKIAICSWLIHGYRPRLWQASCIAFYLEYTAIEFGWRIDFIFQCRIFTRGGKVQSKMQAIPFICRF